MDTRTEIAFMFTVSKGWIGGVYYLQNIISAINTLDDTEKPIINIYSSDQKDITFLRDITQYPYLVWHQYVIKKRTIISKVWNKLKMWILRDRYKFPDFIDIEHTNNILIYPIISVYQVRPIRKALAWIADFQDKYYPENFSRKALAYRDETRKTLIRNNVPVVFSSQDAESDYKKFYPEAHNKTYVLRFAVTLPDFSEIDIEVLKHKYGVTKKYLFCANQFWLHKNHRFLFKAFASFLEKGNDFQLLCSGNFNSYRDNTYPDSLMALIKECHLQDRIRILGLIDRKEQLCLMKHSYAIIQPSLFEGWSTVVEDAKALNKFIFLSDLRVHIEQQPVNVCYFNPQDEKDLVNKLCSVKPIEQPYDYQRHIVQFGDDFMKIVKDYM